VPLTVSQIRDNRPRISVKLNGRHAEFLIDTGSEVSVVSRKFVSNLKSHSCHLVGAGGEKLCCFGLAEANVEFLKDKKVWEFHVMDLTGDGILGVDFMKYAGWSIVQKDGELLPTNRIDQSSDEQISSLEDPVELNKRLKDSVEDVELGIQERVLRVLKDHREVFVRSQFCPGQAARVEHHIVLENNQPIRQVPYRVPVRKDAEIKELVSEMLELGVIEPSSGPWSSPVVLVKKADGSSRFCVDYRKINSVTRKDNYPLPNPQDILASFSDSKFFCTLDLQSGYWQIPMAEEDKDKTAFVVRGGMYRFNVMPFGLCNAVATFQRYMDNVLSCLSGLKVGVYVDDLIVGGATVDEMLQNLNKTLSVLKENHLFVKLKKCEWMKPRVKFLGHILCDGKLQVNEEKVESVRDWPEPRCPREVRAFLGLAGYYRRFVPNFASIAKPLHRLTSSNQPFIFGDEEKTAFLVLKKSLTDACVLSCPVFDKPFVLDVDASLNGIGAVLSQKDESGTERVLEYYSRTLSPAEANYCITRLELLALVSAAKNFHHYLVGNVCVVRTDHSALTWLKSFRRVEGQLARWIESLQNYDLHIEYRPGRIHNNADALSRKVCLKNCICKQEPKAHVATLTSSTTDWKALQSQDDSLLWIIEALKVGTKPPWHEVSGMNNTIRTLYNQWESLILECDILYRLCEVDGREVQQLVVPESERKLIMENLHGKQVHVGIGRTTILCKERFYWPGWRSDIHNFIISCPSCRRVSGPLSKKKQSLASYSPGAPFSRIEMDHFGPLPASNCENKYILVITDTFTKWVEAVAVTDTEAKTTARAFINSWVSRFGVPGELHCDQGRGFESELIKELNFLLGVYKTRTTPYRPQSDGVAERFMRFLKDTIQKLLIENHNDWETTLPWVLLSYRASTHSVTGYSPARCLYGSELSLPVDLLYGSAHDSDRLLVEYVNDTKEVLNTVHNVVRRKIKTAQEACGKYVGRCSPVKDLEPGQQILVLDPSRKIGVSPKLTAKWKGPATVVKRLSMWVYRIRWKGRLVCRHRDHLCPLPLRT